MDKSELLAIFDREQRIELKIPGITQETTGRVIRHHSPHEHSGFIAYFDLDEASGHVVSICAIDNLMKGASGSAVQCMNLMLGFDETLGLEFPGLHPV